MIKKSVVVDPEVMVILQGARWSDNGRQAVIPTQLDRSMYARVNKVLGLMGGRWDKKLRCHVFPDDPRELVYGMAETGDLTVTVSGFFPTPKELAEKMVRETMFRVDDRVLEPSAGEGAIAIAIANYGGVPVCIEQDPRRCEKLAALGFETVCDDFLLVQPRELFPAVIMNPPFERAQDIAHVMHAYDFLAPNGALTAVMSEGSFFRSTKSTREFLRWFADVDGYSVVNPSMTFRPSGTDVNTRLVYIRKRGKA